MFVGVFYGHVDDVAGEGARKRADTDHTDFITDRTDKFITPFSMSHGESIATENK